MHNFILGPVDTDSISFCKPDMTPFTEQEQNELINEINSYMPKLIKYSHDGYFDTVICLKAKNYILHYGKKIKLKGSSIRDQKKEPALKEMIDTIINDLIYNQGKNLVNIYKHAIKEAAKPKDIKRWASKKTITKPILECAYSSDVRLNERKVYDAVKDTPGLQEGDKVYLYPCILEKQIEKKVMKNGKEKIKVNKITGLKLVEKWTGDHDPEKLIERVVNTVDIFSNVIDNNQFVDFTLIKNQPLLEELLNEAN